jgi:hypothetical protein
VHEPSSAVSNALEPSGLHAEIARVDAAERALATVQQRYNNLARETEAMLQLPATPQNIAKLRAMVARARPTEDELHVRTRELSEARIQLRSARARAEGQADRPHE